MFCTVSDMYSGESLRLNVAEEVAWVQLYTCLCYALAIKTITYHTPAASTLDLHKAWSTWHWLVRLTLHCQRHNAVHVSQLVTCQKLVSWPNHIFSPPSSLLSLLSSDMPDRWAAPCGGCRQMMVEFGLDFWIIMTKPDGSYKQLRVRDLVPLSFTAEDLKAGQSNRVQWLCFTMS